MRTIACILSIVYLVYKSIHRTVSLYRLYPPRVALHLVSPSLSILPLPHRCTDHPSVALGLAARYSSISTSTGVASFVMIQFVSSKPMKANADAPTERKVAARLVETPIPKIFSHPPSAMVSFDWIARSRT